MLVLSLYQVKVKRVAVAPLNQPRTRLVVTSREHKRMGKVADAPPHASFTNLPTPMKASLLSSPEKSVSLSGLGTGDDEQDLLYLVVHVSELRQLVRLGGTLHAGS